MGVIIIKTLEINSQPFMVVDDIENGFMKGSLWKNLYDPYKFIVEKINVQNDIEQLLYILQVYTFAGVELSLYIDTHSNCKEAIEMLKKVNSEKVKIVDYIESKYNSISNNSEKINGYYDMKMSWCDR